MGKSLKEQYAELPETEYLAFLRDSPDYLVEEMLRGEWWWTARPEQIPPDSPWFVCLAVAGRGFGKQIDISTYIPTIAGAKQMGNLLVGDEVLDEQGKPCRVTATFDDLPEVAYRLTFSDGTTVKACSEHQWMTWRDSDLAALLRKRPDFPENWPTWRAKSGAGPKIRVTQDIVDDFLLGLRHYIPAVGHGRLEAAFSVIDVEPIDPIPMRCITVDSPNSMYLITEAMIPTHNTRAGSEWVVERTLKHPYDTHGVPTEWLLVAETLSDARAICVEGPAGIVRVLERRKIKHQYVKSPRPQIRFPNGVKIHCEGADDPDVGRGYNAAGAWLDEICVAEGELVATSEGDKPIEAVRAGDLVLTRDGFKEVLHAEVSAESADVIRIEAEDGAVTLTPNHKVWSKSAGWIPASHIEDGNIMLASTLDGVKWTRVFHVHKNFGRAKVYDLEVEGAPEFFAGNLLVHNCKWKYSKESWDEGIMPSLRADLVNDQPRAFVTTTPKPIKILREWLARTDGSVHLMRGSTFDNSANLSSAVLTEMKNRYEGTVIGRQELYGEIIEAFEGALFSRLDLENHRVQDIPDEMTSVIVGVDPSLTGEDDEMGVVVVGGTADRQMYVLADKSILAVGRAAALHAWRVVAEYGADLMVYESNLGKRWMATVFEDAYQESIKLGLFAPGTRPPMKPIDAKIGKRTRGEPVAMRSEQGRLHFVGRMPELEDQCATFTAWGTAESPDRLDALVHACRWIMLHERKSAAITSATDFSSTLQDLFAQTARW